MQIFPSNLPPARSTDVAALDHELGAMAAEIADLRAQLTESQRLATVGTIAAVIAAMCASLNDPALELPRCPDVPKLTRWAGSLGSGTMSW